MIDSSLLLYLPFDDPDGNTAYDYSANRKDATLSDGATFTKEATIGKALSINGGECQTPQAIPLTSDFTLSLKVRSKDKQIGWLLACSGLNNYLEHWVVVPANEWVSFIFVKEGSTFKAYKDAQCVFSGAVTGTVQGFSINSPSLGDEKALVDDLRLYNKALSVTEVMKLQAESDDVEYYIDDVNFKDFGVYVSQETGLTGRLAQKESLTVDYDNYHGVVRAKKRKRFKERVITLECFLEASSRSAFVDWQSRFFALFDGDGTHRLKVEYNGLAKPLVYEVDLIEEVEMSKKWSRYNNDLNVGTFKMKLQEDEPVKRVLRHVSKNANSKATITLTSNKLLNIYWGDGNATYNVKGTQTLDHTYAIAGEYDIIITGVIEDITGFSTSAIVVWDILK